MPPAKRTGSQRKLLSQSFTRNCTIALVCGYAAVVFVFSIKYSLGVADYEPPRRRAVPIEYATQDLPNLEESNRLPAAAAAAAAAATPHRALPIQADTVAAKAAPAPAPVHAPAPLVAPALRGAREKADVSSTATAEREAPAPQSFTVAKPASNAVPQLVPAPVPTIVDALLSLAALPAEDLKRALDPHDAEHNYFGLPGLTKGECPASGSVNWLPAKPPTTAAVHFRDSTASKKAKQQPKAQPSMVWYEHLSKAGGTSFCKLAKKNMPHALIPDYYCMPSEPGMPDARVGQWPNSKLASYAETSRKTLVSNEWEPFPLERLEWASSSSSSSSPSSSPPPLELVLVTTMREPLNRLLSAYRFWGVLHNPATTKPPASRWLRNMEARAKADSKSPRGMGKGAGTGKDFIARVGQPNFATWKFSGGTLPVFGAPFKAQPVDSWRGPFVQAVRTLAAFDLAVPMELLSAHPEPLGDLLGWHDFRETHVVPSGKVVNNDAHGDLTSEEYAAMEDANRLDLILYAWVKAIYLVRIHCPPH